MDREQDRVASPRREERRLLLVGLVLLLGVEAVVALGCGAQFLARGLGYHTVLGDPLARLEVGTGWAMIVSCLAGAAVLLVMGRYALATMAVAWALLVRWYYLPAGASSVAVYSPALLFRWRERLPPRLAELGEEALTVAVVVFCALVACTVAASWPVMRRMGAESEAHGSAALASRGDVRRLLKNQPLGVTLGVQPGTFGAGPLKDSSSSHALILAPSQSGKTSGVVIPTLLEYTGSCLVLDRKGELWHGTAGYRSTLGRVMRFDASAKDSAHWNPLMVIQSGASKGEVAGAQVVAQMLVDPSGVKDTLDFWDSRAMALLSAMILHVLYGEEDKSLGGCYGCINRERSLEVMAERAIHPLVVKTVVPMLALEERTRSGIIATAQRYLELLADPVLAQRLRRCDFVPGDFMHRERPFTLYVTGGPQDMRRILPLVRLLIMQTLGTLTAVDLTPSRPTQYRQPLLLVLDEFAGLGKLQGIESYLAEIAGYGIRALIIVQALGQLQKLYGRDQSITVNCPVKVAIGSGDLETAKMLSEAIGRTTLQTERRSESRRGMGGFGDVQRSVGEVEMGRYILTPDEILRMKRYTSLVFVPGIRPMLAKQRFYGHDPVLAARMNLALEDGSTKRFQRKFPWEDGRSE